jgi:uncharacterized glyoxalase superfamily protein PhnB
MKMKNDMKMPEIKGIAPLLQVFDMPVTLKFYRDILGFEKTMSSGEGDEVDWVLLKGYDIEIMFNTAYEKPDRPAKPDPLRTKGHGDTFLYFGCPDTDTLYTYLSSKGIDLKKPVITGYGWRALHLNDPDGYQLCFHWPLEDTNKRS